MSTTRRSTGARALRRSPTRRCGAPCAATAAPDPLSKVRLTIRRGAQVSRERYENVTEALEALERHAGAARRDGRLPEVNALRDFKPADRVSARLEISVGGTFRGRAAGVDVMGDGSVVAFRGGVSRSPLEPRGSETVYDAVRRDLEG